MDIADQIQGAIEPALSDMGYGLVRVSLADGKRRAVLQVMAERSDGVAMSFDDCERISRRVSALLDVEDPIAQAYDLEVCSPGIDRPLVRLEDFSRFAGHDAKVETQLPIAGRRRFRGAIAAVRGSRVVLAMPDMPAGEVEIEFTNVRAAKLMLTQALIAAAATHDRALNPTPEA